MKRIILTALMILLLATGVAVGFALGKADKAAAPSDSTSSPQNADEAAETPAPAKQTTTLTGEMECLPWKDDSEVHDMSCAIGLKADDGKHYALNASDPTLTGSIPTGQRVKAVGSLTDTTDSKYDIAGVLSVTTITRL